MASNFMVFNGIFFLNVRKLVKGKYRTHLHSQYTLIKFNEI